MRSLRHYKVVLYVLPKLIQREIKYKTRLALSLKIRMWFNGFFSKSWILYNFSQNDPNKYVSDFAENVRTRFINHKTGFIDSKIVAPFLFSPYVKPPRVYAIVVKGRVLKFNEDAHLNTIEDIMLRMEKGEILIFKEIEGASGVGVYKMFYDGNTWVVNGKTASREKCADIIRSMDNYLVSEFARQAAYSQTIYPNSVNTIRILTMQDPQTGEAFIARAAHRIGNNVSQPVDNCAMGGFTAAINTETGIMGKATSTILSAAGVQWHTHHPDSGSPIAGVQIPNWEYIKSKVLAMANSFFFLPYMGWDIVVTDDSFTILETNDCPDLKLHQVHEPLLTDERIKKFYTHHGVI